MPGITVIEDTVEGQSFKQGEDRRQTRVRTFKVYNLNDRRDPLFQAKTAIDAIDATKRIPRYGDFHRVIPGLVCRSVEAEHFNVAWNQAKVTCTYTAMTAPGSQPFLVDILINGVSVMKTTNFDANGNIKWVYYSQGFRSPGGGGAIQKPENDQASMAAGFGPLKPWILREPAESQVPASAPIIEFVFVRLGNPWTAWGDFVNTVNGDKFQGDDRGIWVCRHITGHTAFIAGSIPTTKMTWRASIVFQRSPNGRGFVDTQLFRDSRTGKVPADIDNPPQTTNDSGNIYPVPGQKGRMGYAMFNDLTEKKWAPLELPDLSNL